MDRAFAFGAGATPPTPPASPSIGYAQASNPGLGAAATLPGVFWYHMITEEIRNVIAAAGLTPDRTDVTQLGDAISAMISAAAPPAPPPAFPTGTVMLFVQTAAPAGWTKSVAHDNKALRVVSGAAATGGALAFTTAFANRAVGGAVGDTTLSTAQIPSHTHTVRGGGVGTTDPYAGGFNGAATFDSGAAGGGGSHTHSFSGTAIDMAVQYVDVIIATKV